LEKDLTPDFDLQTSRRDLSPAVFVLNASSEGNVVMRDLAEHCFSAVIVTSSGHISSDAKNEAKLQSQKAKVRAGKGLHACPASS
jgi:hypothetical protein